MSVTDTKNSAGMILLKRQVTVKTLVTDSFKEKAGQELSEELKLIETQLAQLEAQYQHALQQLESLAQQGQNVQRELEQLHREAQEKRAQLSSLKVQVSSNMANIGKIENGSYIVTGLLENFVDVRIGDNIYEKMKNAEILVEDGIVKNILG
jgi:chromosome segregation ATPase